MIESNLAVQRDMGVDAVLLTPTQLKERFPLLRVDDLREGVYSPEDGWFDEQKFVPVIHQQARDAGVTFVSDKVVGFEERAHAVTAARLLSGGVSSAGYFVNAAGPWAQQVSHMIDMQLPVNLMHRFEHVFRAETAQPDMPYVKDLAGLAIGVQAVAQIDATIAGCEVILLATKPQIMQAASVALKSLLAEQLVITIAAGVQTADLSGWLGAYRNIVRVMPNTPTLIGMGISGLAACPGAAANAKSIAIDIMGAVGETIWFDDESRIDAVTAISGSGPAYVFLLHRIIAIGGGETRHGYCAGALARYRDVLRCGAASQPFQRPCEPIAGTGDVQRGHDPSGYCGVRSSPCTRRHSQRCVDGGKTREGIGFANRRGIPLLVMTLAGVREMHTNESMSCRR